ncbi:MAG: DNA polymerase sliding clamp [Candidatus Aramenus sp.]|jgi:proliferating cell nuclear antigen|nr:DNA polymerase sliding clamp [Candidatus Aramenus sp.]
MKFKAIDASALANIFATVGEFMNEASIVSTKDGIRISGIDPSRVVFLDIFLPSAYFEDYESEEKEVYGFSLKEVNQVLKRVKKNDSITIYTEQEKINVDISDGFERIFKLPILGSSEPQNPSMNLEFPFKAKLLTAVFSEVISDLSNLGDTLIISSKEQKLYLEAQGDLGNSTVELSTDNGGLIESEGSDATSTYGMEYVYNTIPMRKPSDTVQLAFGSQLPLKLRYELPQGGYGDFYIAPRVE